MTGRSLLFIWSVSFVWLNQTDQIDQMNHINHPLLVPDVRLSKFCYAKMVFPQPVGSSRRTVLHCAHRATTLFHLLP